MFEIATQSGQYETLVLTDEPSQSRLEVVPERGGMVTRWAVGGQELLYLDQARFANPDLSVRGGIPILFPICGNLPDNTYTHNGKPYQLKQHGFARDLPWRVGDRTTDGAAALTLTLTSNEQTRARYPFEFHLAFTYRLAGNTLTITQQVTNRSPEPMPFALGLHPYFGVRDKQQLQFDIPASSYLDHRDRTSHEFSGQFDFDRDEIDVIFRQPARPWAAVTDLSRHLQIRIHAQPPYQDWVFWTVKGKDYYCLEPWSAPRNALNTGDALTHLAADASLETVVTLTADSL
jgi:galactose mutarotase-like enzyme